MAAPYRETTREEEANYAEETGSLRHQRFSYNPRPIHQQPGESTYEEDADYAEQTGAMRYPHQTTTMERIRGAAGTASGFARGVHGAARDAGRDAMTETGIGPMNAGVREYSGRMGSGFGATGAGVPRSARSREQANVPEAVPQTSVIHPGNKLYVIEGSILAAGGGVKKPRQPEQRKPGFGGFDPGL